MSHDRPDPFTDRLAGRSPLPRDPAPPRANNFDAVRLLAALAVVFSHSFLIAEGSEAREPFVRLTGNQCILGLVGVFVFFILSGYLVTGSWCRRPATGDFAMRRVLRIMPALVVNMLVCAFLIGPLVTRLPLLAYLGSLELAQFCRKVVTLDPGPLQLPGVLFADNPVGLLVNGSLWTLRYEAMMYATVLLLGLAGLLRLSTALALMAAGIAAVAAERALTPFDDIGEWAWFLAFFGSGMALYFLRERIAFRGDFALLALLALAFFAWLGQLIMLFPLAGAYLVIWFARRHDRRLDYSRYVGDLSYGLYIYGWPSQQLVMWLSGGQAPWWEVFLGALAIALPAAWLSWHGVEKWALRWRRDREPRLAVAAGD
ncbi:MAG: acyltransferase family protein [Thiohalocapsa sp.]